jgi:hypothetical protein
MFCDCYNWICCFVQRMTENITKNSPTLGRDAEYVKTVSIALNLPSDSVKYFCACECECMFFFFTLALKKKIVGNICIHLSPALYCYVVAEEEEEVSCHVN